MVEALDRHRGCRRCDDYAIAVWPPWSLDEVRGAQWVDGNSASAWGLPGDARLRAAGGGEKKERGVGGRRQFGVGRQDNEVI